VNFLKGNANFSSPASCACWQGPKVGAVADLKRAANSDYPEEETLAKLRLH